VIERRRQVTRREAAIGHSRPDLPANGVKGFGGEVPGEAYLDVCVSFLRDESRVAQGKLGCRELGEADGHVEGDHLVPVQLRDGYLTILEAALAKIPRDAFE
jgi:hypothetical protein